VAYIGQRLDKELVERGLVSSRSQADNYIRLGYVYVDSKQVKKSGLVVSGNNLIELKIDSQYVSRAGLKLESVAKDFNLDFVNKIVLDVGSSTGGFTDYAIKNGALKVYCVDVGTNQLHNSLRNNSKIELHEKTDIRHFKMKIVPDIILMDVSFISVRQILPYLVNNISGTKTVFIVLLKPQFEAGINNTHKGIVKNETIRRRILKDFENWAKEFFVVVSKKDSLVAGESGNKERFYLLTLKRNSTTSSGLIT